MKKFSFCKYDGKNIVLLDEQWCGAWITQEITKTGLLRSVDHYVFEKDMIKIKPIMNIKDKELERLKIYHNDFVKYYEKLKNTE